jgi:cardiolipin synthase
MARYVGPHSTIAGNSARLFRYGADAFPQMSRAIARATKRVFIEMYILDELVGHTFEEPVREAVQRGAQVYVLYDSLGSMSAPREFLDRLVQAGAQVRAVNPLSGLSARWLPRDHRKLVVIDDESAFVGGYNLSRQWESRLKGGLNWRDDVLFIEGPVVRELSQRFRASWRYHVGERLPPPRRTTYAAEPGVNAYVLSSRRALIRAYRRAIDASRASVMLAHAYFVPPREVIDALCRAARRGVQVTLILNQRSDHWYMLFGARGTYEELLEAGVQIHEWAGYFLHSKTAVVDGTWATVGSFNLDSVSRRWTHELNVCLADTTWAGRLEAELRADLAGCRRIEPAGWRSRPLKHRALETLCRPFAPLL